MKILNDYMERSYRMEIIEDKDEGGFVDFLSRSARLHYLRRDCGKCGRECIGCEKYVT